MMRLLSYIRAVFWKQWSKMNDFKPSSLPWNLYKLIDACFKLLRELLRGIMRRRFQRLQKCKSFNPLVVQTPVQTKDDTQATIKADGGKCTESDRLDNGHGAGGDFSGRSRQYCTECASDIVPNYTVKRGTVSDGALNQSMFPSIPCGRHQKDLKVCSKHRGKVATTSDKPQRLPEVSQNNRKRSNIPRLVKHSKQIFSLRTAKNTRSRIPRPLKICKPLPSYSGCHLPKVNALPNLLTQDSTVESICKLSEVTPRDVEQMYLAELCPVDSDGSESSTSCSFGLCEVLMTPLSYGEQHHGEHGEEGDSSAFTEQVCGKQPPGFENLPPKFVSPVSSKLFERSTHVTRVMKMQPKKGLPTTVSLCKPGNFEYLVRNDNFVILGSGRYGRVFLAHVLQSNKLVAIKAIKKENEELINVINEARILQLLNSTHATPKFYGLIPFEKSKIYMEWGLVTEFIGDPHSYGVTDIITLMEEEEEGNRFSKRLGCLRIAQKWIHLAISLTKCLHAIHLSGVIINDLKCDNILIKRCGKKLTPCLIDFGFATTYADGMSFRVASPDREKYMKKYSQIAPEIVYGQKSTTASDVYSLGRILHSIGKCLGMSILSNVTKSCLCSDPEDRPTCIELVKLLTRDARKLEVLNAT